MDPGQPRGIEVWQPRPNAADGRAVRPPDPRTARAPARRPDNRRHRRAAGGHGRRPAADKRSDCPDPAQLDCRRPRITSRSVGVLVHFLAARPSIQREVRALVEADDHVALAAAVEEVLRIDDPSVSNRRVTTQTVILGGEEIGEGEPVLLNWTAASRDPLVFADPNRYDTAETPPQPPVRHRAASLSLEGTDADEASGDARGAVGQDLLDRARTGPSGGAGDTTRGRLGARPGRTAVGVNDTH